MNRRTFLKSTTGISSIALLGPLLNRIQLKNAPSSNTAQVVLIKTQDRAAGTQRALELLGLPSYQGVEVFVKPNFNSADAAPGSTHNDVLAALVKALQEAGASRITVGDRSGMGDTRQVMERKGIFDLSKQLGFKILVFDELLAADWQMFQPTGSHWEKGFALPKPVLNAGAVVQTCCLKTHRYGGHFTLSLKNSVGLVAKYVPGNSHNFMSDLHSSPHQRRMIAEINTAYTPDFVLMDGVEAFVTGGPDTGRIVNPGVILASRDRIAIDAVGVAILRHFGTTAEVSRGPVFQQEQLAHAVELGIGVSDPSHIELVTDDASGAAFADTLKAILTAA